MKGHTIRILITALLMSAMLALTTSPASAHTNAVASYYGFELAGQPTASGVPFEPLGYTAAHKTLPLGTELTVCFESCVNVVVNDRGPFVEGRDLDLSYAAARDIGLVEAGVAPVFVY